MRSPLFKKLPSCLLGAVIAASTAVSVPVSAVDGNPPGLFELDGDIPAGDLAGDDWGLLYNGGTNDGGSPNTFTGIVADPAPASIFTQGGSKDVNDVSAWKHTNGSVPDKDDITNAYAAAYTMPDDVCFSGGVAVNCTTGMTPVHRKNDLIIYFGLDRYANNGDAFAGFWFFQSTVSLNANGSFNGNHVAKRDDPDSSDPSVYLPGDMFVIVEYPQASGAVPIIKVYEWDPNDADGDKNWDPDESKSPPTKVSSPLDLVTKSADAECDLKGGKLACAISNLTPQASPSWPYTPKSGTGLPYESFFEGGINVTRLLGSTPCFASFLAETRSSSSQTAQLKDFVLDEFPVCGIEVTKNCDADLNSAGTGVDVTFSGTVTNSGGSTFIAYIDDNQTGATIDEVCIDAGNDGCGNDADVAGLVKQADGSAYFPLPAGAIVRYEGSYEVGTLPTSFKMTDTVTAQGFADVDDVGTPALAIVSDTATAECFWNVDPGLTVEKQCDIVLINGDHAEVTISGTVTNSGDVALSGVTVTDSDPLFGTLSFPTTLDKGASDTFSKTVTVPFASLAPGYSTTDGLTTVTLNHADTVTAQGKVMSGTTVLDTAEGSDSATCDEPFTRGISVDKACSQVILEPDANGRLVVKVKVSATVTNTGQEDLQNIVLSDNPAVVFESYPSTLAGGQSTPASFTVDGYYYPTSAIDLTNLTSLSFPDEATVTASGVLSGVGGGQSTDSDDADCPLCPVPD